MLATARRCRMVSKCRFSASALIHWAPSAISVNLAAKVRSRNLRRSKRRVFRIVIPARSACKGQS